MRTIKETDSEDRAEKRCEKIVTTKPDILSRSPITPLQRKYLAQAKAKLDELGENSFGFNPEVTRLLSIYRMDTTTLLDESYYNDKIKMWNDQKSIVVQTGDLQPYQTLVAKDKGEIVAIKLELENPVEILDEDE